MRKKVEEEDGRGRRWKKKVDEEEGTELPRHSLCLQAPIQLLLACGSIIITMMMIVIAMIMIITITITVIMMIMMIIILGCYCLQAPILQISSGSPERIKTENKKNKQTFPDKNKKV